MVGNVGHAQPVAPEVDGSVQRLDGLLQAGRGLRVPPGQDHECRLALAERGPAVATGTKHAELDAARQVKPDIPFVRGNRHGGVLVTVVVPRAASGPVVEQRNAVRHDLDPATDAGRDPDQRADSAEIGRSPVVIHPPGLPFGRADGQEVLHDHPSRGGLPGGLQHHRPRDVPAMLWHLGVARTDPEGASGTVQQRPEHARRVGARQAQPLDGAVGRYQAALLTVGQEPVLGNRRKRAHRYPPASCTQDPWVPPAGTMRP
jgi:hypothetical protein